MGQYLNGVGPLVAKGVMPFQAAQSMLLAISRRFRFGTEIEDYLKQMKEPPPENDGKEAAAQAEAMKGQLELDKQKAQMDVQVKTMQAEKQLAQKENDLALREMQLKTEQQVFDLKKQVAEQTMQIKAQGEHQKVQHESKVAALQNSKFKTENVVNQKADQTITAGVKSLQGIIEQLIKATAMQAAENQQMMAQMTAALTAPRKRKAIRGKDGKLEGVEEMVA